MCWGEWGGWKERRIDLTKITQPVTKLINKEVTIICTGRNQLQESLHYIKCLVSNKKIIQIFFAKTYKQESMMRIMS